MPTALTYSSFVNQIQVLTEFNAADPNFTAALPGAISYAEDRINRELNLLTTVASNSSLHLTAGSRQLAFSTANVNVLKQVNVITPYTTTNPELGTRNPVTPVDESFLDLVYGSAANPGVPANFAMLDNKTLLFGPFPDQNYTVELVGTIWMTPLSTNNTTTWISTYLPDLMTAAAMIYMTGFMRNFGAQSDDPQMGLSWEAQYSSLRDSASVEEQRRKFQSAGWTSSMPSPATPPRT
jgi:hypothetical protein